MRKSSFCKRNAKRLLAGMLLLMVIFSAGTYEGLIPKEVMAAKVDYDSVDTVKVYDLFDITGGNQSVIVSGGESGTVNLGHMKNNTEYANERLYFPSDGCRRQHTWNE